MNAYETKIKEYMTLHHIQAEHLVLEQSCHSVQEAAMAVQGSADQFVKNICMIDEQDRFIVAIVKGEDRASTTRVGKALEIAKPRLANETEVLERTGYPAGGVPSFGFDALFLIDPKVAGQDAVYTGGGSPHSLIKIAVPELLRASGGEVARVRK
ncbi:prolyl-tRNA synthetase [Paenibacillus dendritiformis]|uniref:aminoacyl-tRNA deacylase n=1 Tax=Paenibacillus dendritiformis TaxID=130049 RepID=UPI0018CE1673|nr:YbaK/EbsC family protein [Paenibacillus dendritiformis]MBG9794953.1 prolyl-tRNA synthetase [Paenibacillus dendritiformis]